MKTHRDPTPLNRPGTIRAVWLIAGFTVLTAPAVAIQLVLAAVSKPAARRFPNVYFSTLARLLGLGIKVQGSPPADEACLWVSNHVSWLDIIILGAVRPVTFVAKSEVAGWPVFGLMARAGRTIFIERDRRHKTVAAKSMMETRLGDAETVVLFAEGTSSDGNRVLALKSALLGAVQTRIVGQAVAVQPVSLAYTHRHGMPMGRPWRSLFAWYGDMELIPHLWQVARNGPIDVTVVFGDRASIHELGDRKALARHCHKAILHGLHEALYRPGAGGHELTPGAKPATDPATTELVPQ